MIVMAISYNRLWKLLIDRKMKKKELCESAKISHVVLTRMAHGESVTTDSQNLRGARLPYRRHYGNRGG